MGTRSKHPAEWQRPLPVDRGARARLDDHEARLRQLEAMNARILGALALVVVEIPVVMALAGWFAKH